MSQSACKKAYIAERDRINKESYKNNCRDRYNYTSDRGNRFRQNNIHRKFINRRRNKSTMGCCRINFLRQWPES